jgi:type II secretory pathway component GspD/PulD (secretin)
MKLTVMIASVLTFLTIFTADPLNAQRGAGEQSSRYNIYNQIDLLVLPLQDRISGINLTAVPLREVLAAISKANGFSFHFAPTIESLDTPCTVHLTGETVERSLTQILDPKKLAFVLTFHRRVFIFPNTAAERQKYAQSIREFKVVNGDTNTIVMKLNQAMVHPDKPLAMEPGGLRPIVAADSVERVIAVRATADVMDRIARIIAEYDK